MKSHKLLRVFSLFCFFATSFSFYSCSDLETEGGKVNLSFSSEQLFGSRNIILPDNQPVLPEGYADHNTLYIVVSLRGDYKASQSVVFYYMNDYPTSSTFSFDSVPVGSNVYLEANVYGPWMSSYMHMLTGKSSSFTVLAGDNAVAVKMKNLRNPEDPLESFENAANCSYGDATTPGDGIKFYPNGKYCIKVDGSIVSEGTWTSNGDTYYISECIYKTPVVTETVNGGVITFGAPVIVDYPDAKACPAESEDGVGFKTITFTNTAGVEFYASNGA